MMKLNSVCKIFVGCFAVGCIASASAGDSCINRISLLTGFYNLVQNNNRINASTSVQGYPPENVRMSSNGWCSVSLGSMCEGNISRAMEQYLLVDFGAEVVVEAVGTAAASNGNYLESYMIEYARSDGQFFTVPGEDGMLLFGGNSACTQTEQLRQFSAPVIAQYIRIIPMEWVGTMICLKMELYGCFVRECPEVNNLSDNRTLLPDDNVYESSTYSLIVGTQDDVRTAWCSQGTDNSPSIVLTFTQPLYITYAITRGVSIYWLREYSYITTGSLGRSIYADVDGTSVYGQTDNGQYTVLFWEPIDASVVELRIDDWVPIFACVGIRLFGCVSSEAVDHSTLLLSTTTVNADPTISTSIRTFSNVVISSSTSTTPVESTAICASSQVAVTTVMITVTSTVQVTLSQSTTSSSIVTATDAQPQSMITPSSTVTANVTGSGSDTQSQSSSLRISSLPATTVTVTDDAQPRSTITPSPTVTATVTETGSDTQSQSSSLRTSSLPATTVTVTKTVSQSQCTTVTVMITPSTAQGSNQRITDKTDNSCNAVAICIPVAVVIAIVVCVIVLIAVWRLRHRAIYNYVASNPQTAKIYNDLYGAQNSSFKRVYDYPAFLPEKYDDQSVADPVAEKAASTNSTNSTAKLTGKSMDVKNPLYVPSSKNQTVNEETD